ncbi:hypothetical protein FKM82_000974 [Ascaphus truei]
MTTRVVTPRAYCSTFIKEKRPFDVNMTFNPLSTWYRFSVLVLQPSDFEYPKIFLPSVLTKVFLLQMWCNPGTREEQETYHRRKHSASGNQSAEKNNGAPCWKVELWSFWHSALKRLGYFCLHLRQLRRHNSAFQKLVKGPQMSRKKNRLHLCVG